jgi:hypothetical protein
MDETVLIAIGVGVVLVAIFYWLGGRAETARPRPSSAPRTEPPRSEPKVALAVWSEASMEQRADHLRRGAVVVFGPDYIPTQVGLMKEMMDRGLSLPMMGFQRGTELGFPPVPMAFCMLIFACKLPGSGTPAAADMRAWVDPLREKAWGPQGAPGSPEVTCTLSQSDRGINLQLQWKNVSSADVAETARALDAAYVATGGSF